MTDHFIQFPFNKEFVSSLPRHAFYECLGLVKKQSDEKVFLNISSISVQTRI